MLLPVSETSATGPFASLLDRQSELPRSVPLFRDAPDRVRFSWRDWDPALVRSGADLPQYLILGDLDPSTFEQSAGGWSARWQGTNHNTHLEVAYNDVPARYPVQTLETTTTPDEQVVDEAFFRKYQTMPEDTKKKIRKILNTWDEE